MPAVANPPVQAVSHNLRSAVSKAASRIVSENRPLDKQSISPYIGPKSFEPILAAADSAVPSGEIMLRWLARNQNLDGSWNTDVETTSAAILAFIRAGYTTRKGLFRLIIRRAVNWLVNQRGTGFAGYARLLSLEALACATGDEQDKVLARAAMMTLPEPSNELERAVLGENVTPPSVINTLDDLRLASILKIELLVPPGMEGSEELALVTAWSASISQFKMASK